MKPDSRLLGVTALAALLSLPLAALAQEGPEMTMFEQLDADRNGVIDMDEASRSAQVTADFRQIDVDGDGRISRQEWQEYFGGSGAQDGSGGAMPMEPSPSPNRPEAGSSSPGMN